MIEELKEQDAVDKKFNPIQCIRYYFPKMTVAEADYILWEKTCYPFSNEVMLKQVYAIYLKSVEKENESQKEQ